MALYWRRLSSTAIIWARTMTMHHVVRHSLHRIMVLGQISAEKVVKYIKFNIFLQQRSHLPIMYMHPFNPSFK